MRGLWACGGGWSESPHDDRGERWDTWRRVGVAARVGSSTAERDVRFRDEPRGPGSKDRLDAMQLSNNEMGQVPPQQMQ